MDKRDFTVLGLRLFAIYAWFEAFTYLAGGWFATMYNASGGRGPLQWTLVAGALLPTILLLGIGFTLFRQSQRLAEYLLPGSSPDDAPPIPDSRNLAVIAFGAVGLLTLLTSVPRIVQLITRWYSILHRNTYEPITDTFLNNLGSILGTALQFTLSFALILGAKKFTEWWWHRLNLQP